MSKVREVSEKRTINMENESTRLNEQLEAVSSIISGVVLQGETVVEKVCFVRYKLYTFESTINFKIWHYLDNQFSVRLC